MSAPESPGPKAVPSGGVLALVGSGEFLEPMRPVDAALLQRAGGDRVVILPTASAPDGGDVPQRWIEMGVAHFQALGAAAEGVPALTRPDCHRPELVEAVRQADLVYLSGGKPDYLLEALAGTPLWQAVLQVLERGGVVVGCSAGAMVFGGWVPGRFSLRRWSLWKPAFGQVAGAVIAPHLDEIPSWALEAFYRVRPRRSYLIGVDGGTALFGDDAGWVVHGRGRVVIRGGGQSAIYRSGDAVPLQAQSGASQASRE
jgi:cyanophycinase